jgi:hypothetical protein
MIAPGWYMMTWGGYSQRVEVKRTPNGLYATPASGWRFHLDTVPDAVWTPIRLVNVPGPELPGGRRAQSQTWSLLAEGLSPVSLSQAAAPSEVAP